jgi:hypothetical protein
MIINWLFLGLLLVGGIIERLRPAALCPLGGVLFNVAHLILATILQMLVGAGVAAGAISLTNHLAVVRSS